MHNANTVTTTELEVGFIDLSCKDIQEGRHYLVSLISIHRWVQPTGVLANDRIFVGHCRRLPAYAPAFVYLQTHDG